MAIDINMASSVSSARRGRYADIMKRIVDVSLALLTLALFSPLLLSLFCLLTWANENGAVYRHRRVGRNGEPFRCYKFQTMRPDADAVLAVHLADNPSAAKEWSETRKLRDDPRVTSLGAVLRATSLDELPQLFNILFGQMSFVGPRPITFAELDRYGHQAYRYLTVRPGLTGLWQISGRSSLNYKERVDLDMAYLNNQSIVLDLVILLKTIPAVTRTRHAG